MGALGPQALDSGLRALGPGALAPGPQPRGPGPRTPGSMPRTLGPGLRTPGPGPWGPGLGPWAQGPLRGGVNPPSVALLPLLSFFGNTTDPLVELVVRLTPLWRCLSPVWRWLSPRRVLVPRLGVNCAIIDLVWENTIDSPWGFWPPLVGVSCVTIAFVWGVNCVTSALVLGNRSDPLVEVCVSPSGGQLCHHCPRLG